MSSTFSSRIAPLLVAAGLGLAAPAAGAQGETPAVSRWIDGAAQPVEARSIPGPVRVIPTSRDGRLAAWYIGNGGGRGVLAAVQADGTLGAPHRLPKSSTVPAFDARGHGLALVGGVYAKGVAWASVTADGVVGKARAVRGAGKGFGARFDVDADGNAVIAWFEGAGDRTKIRVVVRRSGGSFGAPTTLAGSSSAFSDITDLSVAVGAGGRALVSYVNGETRAKRRVLAWTGTVRRGFTGPRGFGRPENRYTLESTITSKGRAIVVWASQRGGEEPGSPWVVQSASLAPSGAAWTRVQTIDAGDYAGQPSYALELADGPRGTTAVAWDGVARRSNVPKVASLDASGNLDRQQILAPAGEVTGVAFDASGNAVVGWQTGSYRDGGPTGAFMAVRSGGARRFGTPEAITAPGAPFFLAGGRPAFARIDAPADEADDTRSLVVGQRAG